MTIIIPAYKPDDRLPPYVQALRDAGVGKIVIVDDGSDVPPIYVGEYKRVIYARQPNGGEPVARNTLLSLARGEWFTFIDCDDDISDDYLSVVIGNMREGYDWVSYNWTCDGSRSAA